MNNAIVVETQNLSKTFSGREVIKNSNMTVKQGTIYGFLGANGAGKTTIFKMLAGLLVPTMGRAVVLDMDVVNKREEILKYIGSIIEVSIFYEHLTAIENLEIHLSYMGAKGMDVSEVLSMVGLEYTNRQPVSKFSLGMRQRLGIARSLVHNPKILLLDEPINGLDPMGIREMRELFLNLAKERNMTIMISSHILSELEHIADAIGVIVNGTVIQEVALASIQKQYPSGLEEYFLNIMGGGKKND